MESPTLNVDFDYLKAYSVIETRGCFETVDF